MIRLAIRVSRERAELVLAELLELVPDGVEEVDLDEHTVEYAAYGAPGELPALPDLQALAGGSLVALSTSEVADDWSERWRRFHRPVLIAPPPASELPALRVRPPWEPAAGDGQARLQEIVIDPAQAFGTGAHATTRLCLELLLELSTARRARGEVLDVGTGSGVLAIAAAHLRYAPVLALDNDPESIAAARLNADANGVAIELRRLDLRTQELPTGAQVVCANLLRPLLVTLAATMQWTPAALIAGGLLHADVEEVAAAFAQHLGLGVRERRNSGEWSALLLARQP